jgi:hypothetical protein
VKIVENTTSVSVARAVGVVTLGHRPARSSDREAGTEELRWPGSASWELRLGDPGIGSAPPRRRCDRDSSLPPWCPISFLPKFT